MVEHKDIRDLSITDLEALGYQTLKKLEIERKNLETIERLIQQKQLEVQKNLEADDVIRNS